MAKAKVSRKRKTVLTDDPNENVKGLATQRLITALNSIRVFGQCYSRTAYNWQPEQIEKAEEYLLGAVEKAITQIKNGQPELSAEITL